MSDRCKKCGRPNFRAKLGLDTCGCDEVEQLTAKTKAFIKSQPKIPSVPEIETEIVPQGDEDYVPHYPEIEKKFKPVDPQKKRLGTKKTMSHTNSRCSICGTNERAKWSNSYCKDCYAAKRKKWRNREISN